MEDEKLCDNCRIMCSGEFVESTCKECFDQMMLQYADEAECALCKLAPPEKMGEDEDASTVYDFIQSVKKYFNPVPGRAGSKQ